MVELGLGLGITLKGRLRSTRNPIKSEEYEMPAVRRLPDITMLRRLRNNGWRLKEIASEYGVTEAAVWKALERAGETEPIPTYKDLIPWDVAKEHRTTAVMERFRSITRQRRGIPLEPAEERLLARWLDGLEENGVVVDYHPDAPPNAASRKGGFFYAPREPSDEWIVRQPAGS